LKSGRGISSRERLYGEGQGNIYRKVVWKMVNIVINVISTRLEGEYPSERGCMENGRGISFEERLYGEW
jgi:hypothetical protein